MASTAHPHTRVPKGGGGSARPKFNMHTPQRRPAGPASHKSTRGSTSSMNCTLPRSTNTRKPEDAPGTRYTRVLGRHRCPKLADLTSKEKLPYRNRTPIVTYDLPTSPMPPRVFTAHGGAKTTINCRLFTAGGAEETLSHPQRNNQHNQQHHPLRCCNVALERRWRQKQSYNQFAATPIG